jgi:S1-C subfamily serine protease
MMPAAGGSGARRALAAGVAVVALASCGGATSPAVLDVRVADHDATAFPVGNGRAVTVAHVLQAGRPVYVDGHRARVLRVDRRLDVALLAVAGVHGAARRSAARAGDHATVRVVRAGGASSVRATVRRTISAHIGGQVRPALELSADVMPGDSGAPVVDAGGHVIGVVFAQASDKQALTYALDARALGPLLTQAGARGRGGSLPR